MKYNKLYKYYFFLLFHLFLTIDLFGTHIVGGEMTYSCLGNQEYEIRLTVFRDCYYGNPNAYFDNPASIGIFDASNELVRSVGQQGQLLLPLLNDDTLQAVLSSPCFTVPPDVCVHTTTYIDTIVLPFREGGYQLAYQRCCRNQSIMNIVDPLSSGATYGVTISENALNYCNSSAKFNAWPPLYICVDEPIFFDQSAIDEDGDSIVYRLCSPSLGASVDYPIPQPPNAPPYDSVNWIDPPYGVENMLNGLNGGEPLAINPNTGTLTGLPNTIGQFVVGICLEEYRNGELISTTKRDFQYNVGVCGETVSSFFTPGVVCKEDYTVVVENQSENADDFAWYFNDPLYPDSFSVLETTHYTYSDTGIYEIMLIAEPNTACVDTFYQSVRINEKTLFADMSIAYGACENGQALNLYDLSVDSAYDIIDWHWQIIDSLGAVIVESAEQHPNFQIVQEGIYTVSLVVTSSNGCTEEIQEVIKLDFIDETFLTMDSLTVCYGDSITIPVSTDYDYDYQWAPNLYLSDANIPNPVCNPEETILYTLKVIDTVQNCSNIIQLQVVVPDTLSLDLLADTTICTDSLIIRPDANNAIQYIWSFVDDSTTVTHEEKDIIVRPSGAVTYHLEIRDLYGCSLEDSVTIAENSVNISLPNIAYTCADTLRSIKIDNLDIGDTLIYQWTPSDILEYGQGTDSIVLTSLAAGTYYLSPLAENQYGCTLLDSIEIAVLDREPRLDLLNAVQCQGFRVQFSNNNTSNRYQVWDFGDPTTDGDTSHQINPSYTYPSSGTYEVSLYYEALNCSDTLKFPVIIEDENLIPAFDYTLEACSDTALVAFSANHILDSNFISWQWIFDNEIESSLVAPNIRFEESGMHQALLILNNNNGCVDTLENTINIPLVDKEFPDSILFCMGDSVIIETATNTDYIYQWTPEAIVSSTISLNPTIWTDTITTLFVQITSVDNSFCEKTDSLLLYPLSAIDVAPIADIVSCGDSITLAPVIHQEGLEVVWSTEQSVLSTDDNITVLPEDEAIYYLKLSGDLYCEHLDTIKVENHPVKISLDNYEVCAGDSLWVKPISEDNIPLTYSWSPREEIIDTGNEGALVMPNRDLEILVEARNPYGCSDRDTAAIVVHLGITTEFSITASDYEIIEGESISLSVEGVDISDYNFAWTPSASLEDADLASPVARPEETTVYYLSLTDSLGCTIEDSILIEVVAQPCDLPYVFFPNAFSPNGDGNNDILQVYGNKIDTVHWVIYNRWGEKIFEANSLEDTWDGKYKGALLPPDVYGYYLEVECFNGGRLVKKGNITLLR